MIYEIVATPNGAEILKRIDADGLVSWIPMDEANADYQAYLAWLQTEDGKAYLAEKETN